MSPDTTAKLATLSSRDLAALHIGAVQMLDDLNKVTRRLPDDVSKQIEMAHTYLILLEDSLA